VEHISKKPIPDHQRNIIFEVPLKIKRKRMSRYRM